MITHPVLTRCHETVPYPPASPLQDTPVSLALLHHSVLSYLLTERQYVYHLCVTVPVRFCF